MALMADLLRASPEPVVIVPIGPLTNVALLLRLHPELQSKIAHLSIMGGSIGEGNATVSAEFNIYADPEAADIVFRSGVPITMLGLDVTHQALLDRSSAEGCGPWEGPRPGSPRSSRSTPWTGSRVDRGHHHGDP